MIFHVPRLLFNQKTSCESIVVGGQNSWELGGVEMEFLRII